MTDDDNAVGIVTGGDITVRGVAENMDPNSTRLNQITSKDVHRTVAVAKAIAGERC